MFTEKLSISDIYLIFYDKIIPPEMELIDHLLTNDCLENKPDVNNCDNRQYKHSGGSCNVDSIYLWDVYIR
jgi:hypothetical protein